MGPACPKRKTIMKLLFCSRCGDVAKLAYEVRTCACGASRGRYIDSLNAEFEGDSAVLIGFANGSLAAALTAHRRGDREDGFGHRFEAFVIPEGAASCMRRILPD